VCGGDRQKERDMSIRMNLDVEMAKRKMSLTDLAGRVGITMANMSVLKTGKAKAVRLSTLDSICRELDCQPGDILEYVPDTEENDGQQ
jgi:putative transcriptional regulator